MEPIKRMLTLTGRKGGLRRTEAKALHARQNILLRWHPKDQEGTIPVAALIDGETTLKRYLINRGKPFLRAENAEYPDLIPARELVIQGVLIALIRHAA